MSKVDKSKNKNVQYIWEKIIKKGRYGTNRELDKCYVSIYPHKVSTEILIQIGVELANKMKIVKSSRIQLYQEKNDPYVIRLEKSTTEYETWLCSSQGPNVFTISFRWRQGRLRIDRKIRGIIVPHILLEDNSIVLDLKGIFQKEQITLLEG